MPVAAASLVLFLTTCTGGGTSGGTETLTRGPCATRPNEEGRAAGFNFEERSPLSKALGFKNDIPEWHDAQALRELCSGSGCGDDYAFAEPVKLTAVANIHTYGEDDFDAATTGGKGQVVGFICYEGTDQKVAQLGAVPNEINTVWIVRRDGAWFGRIENSQGPPTEFPSARTRFAQQAGPTPADTAPGAAQWGWNASPGSWKLGQALVGFRCGRDFWCEFGTSALPTPTRADLLCTDRHRASNLWQCWTKGWYDDQVLAKRKFHVYPWGWKLHPSGVYAKIFPTFTEVPQDVTVYETYQRVAIILVDKKYEVADIELDPKLDNELWVVKKKDADLWRYKLVQRDPTDPTKTRHSVFEASRNDHAADVAAGRKWVPPIVRWAWLPVDESNWGPCGPGCCEGRTAKVVSNASGEGSTTY